MADESRSNPIREDRFSWDNPNDIEVIKVGKQPPTSKAKPPGDSQEQQDAEGRQKSIRIVHTAAGPALICSRAGAGLSLDAASRLIDCCRSSQHLALESLVLRRQLEVLLRRKPKPSLRNRDRIIWVWMRWLWPGDGLVN